MCKGILEIANLQQFYSIHVQLDLEVAAIRLIHLLDVARHFTEESLFDPTFHDAGTLWVLVHVKMGSDDWSADGARGVDDLLDTRHTKRDMCTTNS